MAELNSRLAYIMSMTADLLGAMAQGKGGLRSGPANNRQFTDAFRLMDQGKGCRHNFQLFFIISFYWRKLTQP